MQIFIAAMVTATLTGCASPKAYFVDRGRDAADIFTATVGVGLGAKMRVGPYQVGLLENMDLKGLRGGQFFPAEANTDRGPVPYDSILIDCGAELSSFGGNVSLRRKSYYSAYVFPFLWLPRDPPPEYTNYWSKVYLTRDCIPYFSQIEVVAGMGLTVRVGFNPGELLDFAVGWFGMDLLNDDLERREWKKQSNAVQETGPKVADPDR